MRLKVLFLVMAALALGACQNTQHDTRYLITKNRIGSLTSKTQVRELPRVFAEDSIAEDTMTGRFSGGNEIDIYDKEGHPLLHLQTAKPHDSTSTIANVEIIDTLYHTKAGLHKGSSFKLLKTNYTISRVENIVGAVVVFVNDLNAYFVIDKTDVLEPTDMGTKIKPAQIKNGAKILHFWMGWE